MLLAESLPFLGYFLTKGELTTDDRLLGMYYIFVFLGISGAIPYLCINIWGIIKDATLKWMYFGLAILSSIWIVWSIYQYNHLVFP